MKTVQENPQLDKTSLDYALDLDSKSKSFRSQFHIPTMEQLGVGQSSSECVYLCGNSLGLQPKNTKKLLNEELDIWAGRGVNGHFDHPLGRPWVTIDDHVVPSAAKIVGAKPNEVAVMNSLTANLHFLMVPFYRPTPKKYKILMEAKSFPSDYFCFESQVKFHGYDPKDAIIQVEPRPERYTLDTADILEEIKKHGDEIALVLFSGVQFYTGQFFDIPTITKAGHEKGCIVGWDLAHAVGNVYLRLHDGDVDFACWCSYKYLNSGPGGIGGAFVHEKHAQSVLPRFAGWWGSTDEGKFDMELNFKCIPGANGYRLSNPSVLTVIALKASLDVFDLTTMEDLCAKSKDLTGYLEYLIQVLLPKEKVQIITPSDPAQRGCQLSLLFADGLMLHVFDHLAKAGIVCDERKPNVIRVAPAPLYNTFKDVWTFVHELKRALQ